MLESLSTLSVSYNYLTGGLPTEIGQLSLLVRMFVHTNDMEGTIPSEIGLLSNLGMAELQRNGLTGIIHTEFGMLTSATKSDGMNKNFYSVSENLREEERTVLPFQ